MPTASTSQILGNNETFEPYTANVYTRRVLAGEFVCINKNLVDYLIKHVLFYFNLESMDSRHQKQADRREWVDSEHKLDSQGRQRSVQNCMGSESEVDSEPGPGKKSLHRSIAIPEHPLGRTELRQDVFSPLLRLGKGPQDRNVLLEKPTCCRSHQIHC